MQASHILLRRPWQFDTHTIHDKDGRNIALAPLPPHQVFEEQNQIKKSITASSKKNESESSKEIKRKETESRTEKEMSE